jgi:hypothetical protein
LTCGADQVEGAPPTRVYGGLIFKVCFNDENRDSHLACGPVLCILGKENLLEAEKKRVMTLLNTLFGAMVKGCCDLKEIFLWVWLRRKNQ